MGPETKLDAALDAWQLAFQTGRDRPAADFCDDPDLLPLLRARVQAVRAVLAAAVPDRPDSTVDSVEPLPWEKLGEYRLIARLGRGGMGEVFQAEDPSLGRRVAIKVMRPEQVAALARERFLREARAAAALHHDHIVPIFHVGEDAGTPFLVMPMLAGQSLDDRLAAGPLPPAEVIRIGREAATGLAAAHAAGIVHRDIIPGNLWLEAPNGRVKLLDFGLARLDALPDKLTAPHALLGTPAFMAPEQADGGTADARSDLFSLGATLYLAATGTPAFAGATLTAVLRAIADHAPKPPVEVNSAVPPALSSLILRLLEKNPDDRPPTAEAVAAAFAALEAGDLAERFAPPRPPRRRWPVRWLAALGLAVSLLAIGAWWFTREPAPTADPQPVPVALLPAPVAPAPQPDPLRGSVDILVVRQAGEVLVPLSDPQAMPIRTDDEFCIEFQLNRPAFAYLFWIDENGHGLPVYPWTPGKWGTRPADEKPTAKARVKAPNGRGFRVTGDTEGMETVVMVVRETKLDADDAALQKWFDGLKPLPFRGDRARVWFENFEVLRNDAVRGVNFDGDVNEPDGPRGLQQTLQRRIGDVYSRAISFARVGPGK